jgi:hypothetical protein
LQQISIYHDPAILLREKRCMESKSVSSSALTPFVLVEVLSMQHQAALRRFVVAETLNRKQGRVHLGA